MQACEHPFITQRGAIFTNISAITILYINIMSFLLGFEVTADDVL